MTTTSDPLDVTIAWQEVASGSASVSVQSRASGAVYVAAQAAAPAADSKKGVMLDPKNNVASFSGLTGTDKVFVRAETTATVVVVKS